MDSEVKEQIEYPNECFAFQVAGVPVPGVTVRRPVVLKDRVIHQRRSCIWCTFVNVGKHTGSGDLWAYPQAHRLKPYPSWIGILGKLFLLLT